MYRVVLATLLFLQCTSCRPSHNTTRNNSITALYVTTDILMDAVAQRDADFINNIMYFIYLAGIIPEEEIINQVVPFVSSQILDGILYTLTSEQKKNLLISAICAAHPKVVRVLLHHGTDTGTCLFIVLAKIMDEGYFFYAFNRSKTLHKRLLIFDLLLHYGADPNRSAGIQGTRCNVMQWAIFFLNLLSKTSAEYVPFERHRLQCIRAIIVRLRNYNENLASNMPLNSTQNLPQQQQYTPLTAATAHTVPGAGAEIRSQQSRSW